MFGLIQLQYIYCTVLLHDGWCSVLLMSVWGYTGYYCSSLTYNEGTTFNQPVEDQSSGQVYTYTVRTATTHANNVQTATIAR